MLHRSAPLKGFDPDLVIRLVERTRALGVEVHVQTDVRAIEKAKGGFTVKASRRERGDEISFESDLVVHGGGRVPDIDDLELD